MSLALWQRFVEGDDGRQQVGADCERACARKVERVSLGSPIRDNHDRPCPIQRRGLGVDGISFTVQPRTVDEVPSTSGSAPLAIWPPCPAVQVSAVRFPGSRIVRDEFQLTRDEVPSSYRCRGHRRGGARHGGVRWILRGRRHGTAASATENTAWRPCSEARGMRTALMPTRGLGEGVPHVTRTTYAIVCLPERAASGHLRHTELQKSVAKPEHGTLSAEEQARCFLSIHGAGRRRGRRRRSQSVSPARPRPRN